MVSDLMIDYADDKYKASPAQNSAQNEICVTIYHDR